LDQVSNYLCSSATNGISYVLASGRKQGKGFRITNSRVSLVG